MKIAIPTLNNQLTAHFGHCEKFAIIEVEKNDIKKLEYITPPLHQPGVYPRFLADEGVSVIIAGGMGQRAIELFHQNDIEVYMGVQSGNPETLVKDYLEQNLQTGQNLCDH